MGDFLMSKKEVDRAFLLRKHQTGEITLKQVSEDLGLSYPQTKRIWKSFKVKGEKGLISKARGKVSNRKFSQEFESQIVEILRGKYPDFKPTFAKEKLKKNHSINISVESLRNIMIKNGLWQPKKRKNIPVHQRRARRERFGELIQMDGSDHKWFEERGSRCSLLVAVDDATSKLVALRFEKSESLNGYFKLVEDYFSQEGLPVAFYTDKAGVFRVNQGDNQHKPTQFKRAMNELNVTLICAHSPQAKGRVERANKTLQDRLVKELRLKGISTIEEANKYLPIFRKEYNKLFGKEAKNASNAHRPLDQKLDLKRILCRKFYRKLSKNLELSFKNSIFQIQDVKWKNRLMSSKVQILELLDGDIIIEKQGVELKYRIFNGPLKQCEILDFKEINNFLDSSLEKSK